MVITIKVTAFVLEPLTSRSPSLLPCVPSQKRKAVKDDVRCFPFTINNYTEDDIKSIEALQTHNVKYYIYAKETGESGTPHLQCFVQFVNPRSLKSVSKLLPRAHIEVMEREAHHNVAYCRKENDFIEYGVAPISPVAKGDKEKQRYQQAWDIAKRGGDFEEIDADIRLRYLHTLKKIRSDYQLAPVSIDVLDFRWYYGETGTGKTRSALEEFPQAYRKNTNRWWDGYGDDNTRAVIIDEWSPEVSMLAQLLKKWADHHAFSAETKGGTICIRPTTIIVTSNYSMEECFPDAQNLAPLSRRFKVKHFTNFPKKIKE